MEISILIIDDEVLDSSDELTEPRFDKYNQAFDALSKVTTTVGFRPTFAEDGNDAIMLLTTQHFDFVFVDVMLDRDGWSKGNSFADIISVVSKKASFFLITSRFDETNSEAIFKAMKADGYVSLLQWRDFLEIESQVSFLHKTLLLEKPAVRSSSELGKGPDDDFHILQISDIQVGGYPQSADKVEAQIISQVIREHTGSRSPDFVVCTGDLAQAATPNEFNGATDWLKYLFSLLEFPTQRTERLFIVPGNHDVNIALSAASRIEYLGKESDEKTEGTKTLPIKVLPAESDSSLNELAYRPYKDAEEKLSDRAFYLSSDNEVTTRMSWAEDRFGLLGLLFYGINTARPVVPGRKCGRRVSEDDIAELTGWLGEQKNKLRDKHGLEVFTIGIFHHQPIGDTGEKSIENPEVTKTFFEQEHQTNLLFTGHVHRASFDNLDVRKGRSTLRCIGSTATLQSQKRDEDTNRGFNLVTLKRKENQVTSIEARSFGWTANGFSLEASRSFEHNAGALRELSS